MSNNKNSNAPSNDQGRLHVLGVDVEVDPSVGHKLKRGVYETDKCHTLVTGLPRSGKTRFLLSQIKQHITYNEGFIILDTHSDLSQLVLSHIPPEQWDRVIYINPWTAFQDKYDNKVVQINFLENSDSFEQNQIVQMFADTLEKIYNNNWSVSLDHLLQYMIQLVMEKEKPQLSDLYRILSDEAFRNELTTKCKKEGTRTFWEKQYKLYKNDEILTILTRLYHLGEEPTITPMLRPTTKSSINFKQVIDEKKIIIVDLPKKIIPTDTATFIGSLIISTMYNAALTRKDTYREYEHQPFHIYIEDAYQYITKNILKTIQTLQYFKVYTTLTSQHLEQYHQYIQPTLTQTCKTLITFQAQENTATTLQQYYPEEYNSYQTLMNLPPHQFFVSTPFQGMKREYQILETIDYKTGQINPEEVIRYSLEKYGNNVDVEELMWQKSQGLQQEFLDKPITPSEWATLRTIRQRNKKMEEKMLKEQFLYNNPTQHKTIETSQGLYSQMSSKTALENNNTTEDKPIELTFEGLEKERLMLKLADEGWHFRLKEVKNKSYLCVRKFQEEHSLGPYTKEIKYITEKNKIKIKKNNEK